MATIGSINLITNKTGENPDITAARSLLQHIGTWSLIVFIISGIIVGGALAYFQVRAAALVSDKNSFVGLVNTDTTKEGLLLAVRQRAGVVGKILTGQKNLNVFFDMIGKFVQPAQISSIAMDDTNKTVVAAHVSSVADATGVVDSLLVLSAANQVTKPELTSFTLSKDGGFDISVSFAPVL